jgi:2-dehydropantoate 2-reductase
MAAMNSLIIGPGAIGVLACAQAQQLGAVLVWPHRDNLALPKTLESENHTQALEWQLWLPDNTVDINLIWVCCKAFHAEATVREVVRQFPSTPVLLLHNGMGPQQALTESFGESVIWGSTTCGALPVSTDRYRQTGRGETMLGISDTQFRRFPALNSLIQHKFQPDFLSLKHTGQIDVILWQKLLINACINPVTAYYQIPNGDILAPRHQHEVELIVQEASEILQASNVQLPRPPMDIVNNVARVTALNRSSMAMDIQNHKKTEIDYINGFFISEAARHNIDCPNLKLWHKRIASLSNS